MKKVTCIICVCAMLICFGLGAFASSFSRFDLNEDGAVSIMDVTCLLNYLRNPSTDPEEPEDSGDVDTSSDIAPEDVVTIDISSYHNYQRNNRGWVNSDWSFDSEEGYQLYFQISDKTQILRNVFRAESINTNCWYGVIFENVRDVCVTVDNENTIKAEKYTIGSDCGSISYLLGQLPDKGLHAVQIDFTCDISAHWTDEQWNEFNDSKADVSISGKYTAAMEKLWDDSIGISSIVECNDTSIPVYGNCFRVDVMFDEYVGDINDFRFFDIRYYDDWRDRFTVYFVDPIYCESVSSREAVFYFENSSKGLLINRNEMYIGNNSNVFLYELLKHEW